MSNWEIKRLDEVVSFASGGTPSKAKADYWVGDIPWISASTMHQQEIHSSDLFISEDGLKAGSKLAKAGDLLLLVRGSMLWKKIPICICMRDVAFNQDVKSIKTNDNLMSEFLLYWFLSHEKNLLHKVVGTGIGAGKLDFDSVKSLLIPVPPISEQKEIISILEQWDTAIEKTEALIDAKERQFGWLRSQLIKSCSGEVYTLEELEALKIIKLGRGDVISKKDFEKYPGNYPVYSSSVKKNGVFGKYGKFMFEQELITWSVDGGGDFFYRPKHKFSVTNVCGYMTVNEDQFDYAFLAAQLQQLHARLVFDYQFKAHPSVIRKIYKVKLPPLKEQKRIAHTLNTAKQEITLLKKLADQYRTQKRGLMQKLLTGKWKINNGK